jgi:hypothetical protein
MRQRHSIRKIGLVGEVGDKHPKSQVWAIHYRRYNLSDDIIHISASDAIEAYAKAVKRLENEI